MNALTILCFALLLDAFLGEPRWLWNRVPHPAVLMGRAVAALEKSLNTGHKLRNGVSAIIILCVGAGLIGLVIAALGPIAEIIATAILLAQRSLADHVAAVAKGLQRSLQEGRDAVAQIVSRDTAQMDQTAIARSAIESAAENFSDGVIAPAFWFLLGGVPGIMIYKVVNTADSMIGYRTSRYEQFGKAAARLDDALNWIPARLSALLLALPGQLSNWPAIAKDARLHRSPNAGWPEAAMARRLNTALAGPRVYDGIRTDFPFVHPNGRRHLTADDITACVQQLWRGWAIALAAIAAMAILA